MFGVGSAMVVIACVSCVNEVFGAVVDAGGVCGCGGGDAVVVVDAGGLNTVTTSLSVVAGGLKDVYSPG